MNSRSTRFVERQLGKLALILMRTAGVPEHERAKRLETIYRACGVWTE